MYKGNLDCVFALLSLFHTPHAQKNQHYIIQAKHTANASFMAVCLYISFISFWICNKSVSSAHLCILFTFYIANSKLSTFLLTTILVSCIH